MKPSPFSLTCDDSPFSFEFASVHPQWLTIGDQKQFLSHLLRAIWRVGHPKFAETILDLSLAGGEETRKPLKSVQLVWFFLGGVPHPSFLRCSAP